MTSESIDSGQNNVRDIAAEWVVRLHEASKEEKPQLLKQCDNWLAEHPSHHKIFSQMSRMWDAAAYVPPRKKQGSVLSVAVALVLLMGASWLLPWQYWMADYRTATGEVRTLTLDDGSQIILNSRSAVSVDYNKGYRSVQLVAGEVLAIVGKDPQQRPFRISSRDGEAVALGTRYSVRLFPEHSRAAVQESAITVTPANVQADRVALKAGYAADFTRDGVGVMAPVDTEAFSWTTQRLIFVNQPLPEVVAELSRYHKGFLRLKTAKHEAVPYFTGILPSDNPDAALALLAEALELDITRITPYLVFISQS